MSGNWIMIVMINQLRFFHLARVPAKKIKRSVRKNWWTYIIGL
jgi:hypothetical protein